MGIDNHDDDIWGELIHAYTRKEAIADGVLVNLMQGELGVLVKQAGFKYPIAMTATAFKSFVELTPAAKRAGHDMKGRLWDILMMFKLAIRQSEPGEQTLFFEFWAVTDTRRPTQCKLKSVIGPDDDGAPCITLMLPDED